MTTAEIARPSYRSYSQLDVYRQCPEKFFWKYIQRIPEDPAVWSVGGTTFHAVAEQYLRGDLGHVPSDQQVWAAWTTAWTEAQQEYLDKGADPDLSRWRKANRGREDAGWWMANGYRMVREFIEWKRSAGAGLQVFDLDGTPGLEYRFTVDLGGVTVLAIPDWLAIDEHGQLDVVDYKTGKPPKSPLQLRVYAAVVEAATGMRPTFGLYYMARDVQLLTTDLSRSSTDEITEMFVDFDTRERDGDYKPTPGEACKFCPFKPRCSYHNPESA